VTVIRTVAASAIPVAMTSACNADNGGIRGI
jgi:hypothetical protein